MTPPRPRASPGPGPASQPWDTWAGKGQGWIPQKKPGPPTSRTGSSHKCPLQRGRKSQLTPSPRGLGAAELRCNGHRAGGQGSGIFRFTRHVIGPSQIIIECEMQCLPPRNSFQAGDNKAERISKCGRCRLGLKVGPRYIYIKCIYIKLYILYI